MPHIRVSKAKSKYLPLPSSGDKPVPILHFAQHSHSSSTSNFHPKISLGNARIALHQMRSELPIMSQQVKHTLSNNPIYAR
jgi:hypothetical protein